jgi:hypothetical protein
MMSRDPSLERKLEVPQKCHRQLVVQPREPLQLALEARIRISPGPQAPAVPSLPWVSFS